MDESSILEQLQFRLTELIEDDIDVESNFYDIGGNSLLAIHFLNWLDKNYETNFNIKDLFDMNIIQIAQKLKERQKIIDP